MKPKSFCVSGAALCLAVAVTGSPARSQGYPPSQRGTVTQNVAFTEISVSYGRPVARGRELFGALVPWDSGVRLLPNLLIPSEGAASAPVLGGADRSRTKLLL